MLRLTIYGVPQPQGSIKAFMPKGCKRPVLTSDNAKLKPWRQEVAQSALAEMARLGLKPIARPRGVLLQIAFFFDKPASIKAGASKTTKPDVDKLLRGLADALTGIAFQDDSQVVQCTISKQFGTPARTELFVGAERAAEIGWPQ